MEQSNSGGDVSLSAEAGEPATVAASSTDVAAGDELTGDSAVDEALRELGTLDQLPVHDHADIVERVHGALQDRLSEPE